MDNIVQVCTVLLQNVLIKLNNISTCKTTMYSVHCFYLCPIFILHAWTSVRTCSPSPQRLNVIHKFGTCKSPPRTHSEERKIHLDYD